MQPTSSVYRNIFFIHFSISKVKLNKSHIRLWFRPLTLSFVRNITAFKFLWMGYSTFSTYFVHFFGDNTTIFGGQFYFLETSYATKLKSVMLCGLQHRFVGTTDCSVHNFQLHSKKVDYQSAKVFWINGTGSSRDILQRYKT